MDHFELVSEYQPTGDQPQAIEQLVKGFQEGNQFETLLGVTGSGKTFTMANVIQQINKPTLVIAHNKTLAAQLYGEFKEFFEDGNLSQITTFKNGDMKNIKVFYENGKLLGTAYFEDGEIDRLYLNFSDPWPKKRYAKRRLSSATFLDQYKRILSFNGEIQMKTDNSALFEYSLIEFQNAGFKMVEISVDYRREKHDEDAITEYEQKFISLGQPIYRCVWRYAHD